MTDAAVHDLQAMLDELIDVVQDVKQAHYVVAQRDPFHAELDALFDDLRTWAGELAARSAEAGGSLGGMTTAAGHRPKALFPRERDDRTIAKALLGPLRQAEDHARSYRFVDLADGLDRHISRLEEVAS